MIKISNFNEISLDSNEGKLLLSALSPKEYYIYLKSVQRDKKIDNLI